MPKKTDYIKKERTRLRKHLDSLKPFPNTRTVKQLRKELKAQLDAIERKFATQTEEQVISSQRQIHDAKLSRSNKLRKYHNYLRQIRNNYPDVKYADLRKMFKLRKTGKQVQVPDVVWQNPSP